MRRGVAIVVSPLLTVLNAGGCGEDGSVTGGTGTPTTVGDSFSEPFVRTWTHAHLRYVLLSQRW